MPRRDRSAVGNATAAAAIAEDGDAVDENAFTESRQLAAIADAAGEAANVLGNLDCGIAHRNGARIRYATPQPAGAERRDAADHDTMRLRGDRAAVADAAGEGRNQLDLNAVGAGRNPAAAVINDAAGEERGVVDENAGRRWSAHRKSCRYW